MHRLPHDFGQLERYSIRHAEAETHRLMAQERSSSPQQSPRSERARETEKHVTLTPRSFDARSANELRPATFDQMIGQDRLKRLLSRIVANCRTNHRPLDHLLLVGESGTGKTTLAQVTAHELGATVYQVKAPVTHAVLSAAQQTLADGDVLIVDEVHQQVTGDRRGATQAADPE